ncbi:hypothetical protein GXW82_09120 [Streptacidiphilus sp. 4-A2]|nr:hypothetical protein [Streptacidiphilus sp. 4-A2]
MPPSGNRTTARPGRCRQQARRGRTGRRQRGGFLLLAAVHGADLSSMLSPVLPLVQHDLRMSDAQRTLASTAYGLSFSGLLMLGDGSPTAWAGGRCWWSAWPCSARPRRRRASLRTGSC